LLCILFKKGTVSASALSDEALPTIDYSCTGSVDIYKYDLTSAEKDGVWNSSYVSTGVRDEPGVESILGNTQIVNQLTGNGESYGYAIKGVEFSYLKIADICTYTDVDNNTSNTQVLYGIEHNDTTDKFLYALGLSIDDRYSAADNGSVYAYQSDVLIDALKNALTNNATSVKNALETYVRENGGTAMPETDGYGHSAVSDLPLGLYLFVETRVPEMVTETTAPFLVSLPMTSTADNASWLYDVTLYPKNLTGIPTLEKTVRESKTSSGKNNGSSAIDDGFAHTATASVGDVLEYQILSTLPSITSAASYLTDYSFIDTAEKGIPYLQNSVTLEFFKDAACTDKIATWTETDGKFNVSYTTTESGGYVMSITMTESGLSEINTSKTVYADASMVNSGYSDCTLRITYSAQLDKAANYGDKGNTNDVVLTWKRTSMTAMSTCSGLTLRRSSPMAREISARSSSASRTMQTITM